MVVLSFLALQPHHTESVPSGQFLIIIFSYSIRATLNSVSDPLLNFGTVFALLLSKRFDYIDQAKYQLVFPIIFLLFFVWVPESPEHLMSVQKEMVSILWIVSIGIINRFCCFQAASKAHKFFKGTELEKLPVAERNDISSDDNAELSWRDFGKVSAIIAQKCSFCKSSFRLSAYSESSCTQSNYNFIFVALFEHHARLPHLYILRHGDICKFQLEYFSNWCIHFDNIDADCVKLHFS